MATITGLSGQSSIYELVSQMSQLYRFPIVRMESAKSGLSMLDTIYTDLKSKLKTLNDTAEDLADTINPPLEIRQAASSDATILTATATSSAAVATHAINVEQLARNHTMVSDRFTTASTSIATAEGAGTATFSITVGSTTKNIDVIITATDTNEELLDAVAYAINQAWADEDEPVTANDVSNAWRPIGLREESPPSAQREGGLRFCREVEQEGRRVVRDSGKTRP